ncbi:hypothetical protein [Streptomyces sp. NPDC003247]|uniref:hypothetical protein n=1 Tax=Streptomyces sp. NPDC003247 TaxID=3364677 RepID=UPI0036A6D1B5
MLRPVRDAVVRLLGRTKADERNPVREVRAPDPYVWRLPNPRDARWRRWAKRSRAAGRCLPFPCDGEACWQSPPPPRPPAWQTDDDVVRAYVLRPTAARSSSAPFG